MKLKFLFVLLAGILVLGSCRVVNFSDNAQHKHLRKVAVDTPDPVIKKLNPDITPDHTMDYTDLNADEEADLSIETEIDITADASDNSEQKPDNQQTKVSHKPAKLLSIFTGVPKTIASIAPEEDSYVDPATILIWALIIVLILALLAVLVPQLLDLIIGLLIVVLIVVLILYLANNL
ncbi:MAG: hypothetical protein C0592_13480 [Marinilabiliales bacterium]|nr:MAG: hypothetical protein C0592_13480 [Marinilabiliales bacterium]